MMSNTMELVLLTVGLVWLVFEASARIITWTRQRRERAGSESPDQAVLVGEEAGEGDDGGRRAATTRATHALHVGILIH